MADLVLTPKAPGETVRYVISFPEIDPDVINTFTLTRTAGTIVLNDDSDNDESNIYALISGGADDETATFDCTIVTVGGQTLTRGCSLSIETDADVLGPDSSITKGTIVIRALGKLGIANYVFDTEAEEDVSALRQLDSLAAQWQGRTSQLPYLQPASNGTSLPGDDAGIDEADVDAFIYNLAEVLAVDYGKTPAGGLLKRSADTRADILVKYQVEREYRMPRRTPVGAGNDRYFGTRRFF
jgi:hypothetical protein